MWYLTSESDPRVIYFPLHTKEITIGRSADAQSCNFVIVDDPSISRKHATLLVSENNLVLQDLGSRYGTFINDSVDTVDSNSKVKLNVNDVIKFGKLNSVWNVNEIHFVTCTSTLKGDNLKDFKSTISKLGGILKNEWDDSCAYLTMPAITLTIKVVLALVQGSHIVTTEFWNKCLEAVNNNAVLPNPSKFTPEVVESTLNKDSVSFLPNNRRSSLFHNKNFIFFSKRQLEMYKTVLLMTSATPLLLSEVKMTKSMLHERNVIVIQYNSMGSTNETQAHKNQINEIVDYLKSKGKRVVADAEIGLAVLYCSTDKYCNPDFNFSSEVIKQTTVQNTKTTNILAQESQEPEDTIKQKKENVVINESLTSYHEQTSITSNNKVTNPKRKMSEESDEILQNANKKIAIDSRSISNNEHSKRKFSDIDDLQSNPSKKLAIDNSNTNEGDDIFNFMNPTLDNDKENNVAEKRLNFNKPLKRNAHVGDEGENNLFNFIEDKSKISRKETLKNEHILDVNNTNNDDSVQSSYQFKRNNDTTQNIDISAMRGIKLEELNRENLNWYSANSTTNINNIKKEVSDEDIINVDLVVLKIRNDLIVKREPLEIEAQAQNNQKKNFKKFKKVWPLKMQVSVIPSSYMSVVKPDPTEICSMAY